MVAKTTLQFALISITIVAVAAGSQKRIAKNQALAVSLNPAATTTAAATSVTTTALPIFTPVPGAIFPANWNWQIDYPALYGPDNQCCLIPATNTTLAKEWIAKVNMTAIPSVPLNKDVNGTLVNSYGNNNPYCEWEFGQKCVRGTDVQYCPTKGVFGITVNDGPSTFGSSLYDWLNANNLKATLFWIGSNIAQNPLIAQKGCSGNYHIAFQSWSYNDLSTLTNEQIIVELKWTETIIHELCGISPRYFRPPEGDIDDRVRAIAAQLGYIPVLWDLDTKDWEYGEVIGYTTDQENGNFTAWISEEPADTHGHIILLHESSELAINEITLNIPRLIESSYNAMSVASCLGDAHPYKENVTFCPIWVNNTLIPCAPTNTTSSPTTASPMNSTTAIATVIITASSSTSSDMKRSYCSEIVSVIVVIVAIAMMI
ncbi:hypothetical protein BC937DRAFT_91259 [Endogone sp. FLAS-F59071]|nr:hypothetical protein BC937DRAFT_91259 [Endogone sp. FLAS-F59071]|eukprot:RUS21857.1 hypothetical protein BC937DRAFT_91259 [Endogone sp. FLAS-F59071]